VAVPVPALMVVTHQTAPLEMAAPGSRAASPVQRSSSVAVGVEEKEPAQDPRVTGAMEGEAPVARAPPTQTGCLEIVVKTASVVVEVGVVVSVLLEVTVVPVSSLFGTA
jgi:hypothetical protein